MKSGSKKVLQTVGVPKRPNFGESVSKKSAHQAKRHFFKISGSREATFPDFAKIGPGIGPEFRRFPAKFPEFRPKTTFWGPKRTISGSDPKTTLLDPFWGSKKSLSDTFYRKVVKFRQFGNDKKLAPYPKSTDLLWKTMKFDQNGLKKGSKKGSNLGSKRGFKGGFPFLGTEARGQR